MQEVGDLVDRYMDQEGLYRIEGRRGVETLCQVTGALGYKDPTYYGQLTSKAVIGDLIMFLEDNPGAIEAVLEWVKQQGNSEWRDNLQALVGSEESTDQIDDDIGDDERDE